MRVRKKILSTISAAARLCAILILIACKREPQWLSETEILINKINRDTEIFLPLLAPNASPDDAMRGLLMVEKTVEYSSAETVRLYKKFPQIREETRLADERLASQIRLLRENMVKTRKAVELWQQRSETSREFTLLVQRIAARLKETNKKTME